MIGEGTFPPSNAPVPLGEASKEVELCYACLEAVRMERAAKEKPFRGHLCMGCGRAELPAYRVLRKAWQKAREARQGRLHELVKAYSSK